MKCFVFLSFLCAGAQSDSELSIDSQESKETDHGYTSDSELYKNRHAHSGNESDASTNSGSWLVVSFSYLPRRIGNCFSILEIVPFHLTTVNFLLDTTFKLNALFYLDATL